MIWRVFSACVAAMVGLMLIGGAKAQEATPAVPTFELPIVPGPSDCPLTAAPTIDDILNRIDATPAPSADSSSGTPESVSTSVPFTVPAGTPADPATIDAITVTVVQAVACDNAHGFLAQYAFATDNLIRAREAASPLTVDDVAALATPQPLSALDFGAVEGVNSVTLLPDGRVGAAVTTTFPGQTPSMETDWLIFANQGGAWLVDEEVDNISVQTVATPTA